MNCLKGIVCAILSCALLLFVPVPANAQAAKIIRGASKVVAKKAAQKTATKAAVKTGVVVGTGAAAAAAASAINNGSSTASISLSTRTINLNVGSTTLLYVTMNNPNHSNWYCNSMNTSIATAKWDSQNNAIAVKAISPGKTSIKVQLDGLTDYCEVNVSSTNSKSSYDYPWSSSNSSISQQSSAPKTKNSVMSLSHHDVEMFEGTSVNIKATVSNPNNYEWTINSSDPSVVNWTWDEQAQAITLHAYLPGSSTITSSLGGISDKCIVTVYSSHPDIHWDTNAMNMDVGATTFVKVSAYNPNDDILQYGFDEEMLDLAWDAARQGFTIRAKKAGKATAYLELGTASDVCEITVKPKAATISSVTPQEPVLRVGETVKVIVDRTPYISVDNLIFTSDNPKVAIVRSDGTITAVGKGQTNIWVESGNIKRCFVTVTE